jgi:uncharacterized protein (TIGR02444 family)
LTAWDFALAAWRRPGVEPLCLRLQADHGQCLPLLLWRLWVANEGRTVSPATLTAAIALCREWDAEVVGPLRAIRDGLKGDSDLMPPASRLAMRKTVLAAELEAERLMLDALERLETTLAASNCPDRLSALVEMAEAWRPPAPTALLASLGRAL